MLLVSLHNRFGPFGPPRFGAARSDGDLQHLLLVLLGWIEVADEVAVDLELAQIIVRRHVAAAVPAFVADAEIADLIGSGMTIGGTFLGQGCRLRGGQVFQPLRCFPRNSRPNVGRDVSVGANLVKEIHELVASESIRLDYTAPVRIEGYDTLAKGADPIPPVIFVSEAATGPAHVRHLNSLERGYNVIADAARIWNAGIRADPNAVVNPMAQMLRELAKYVAVNPYTRLGRIYGQLDFLCNQNR